MNSLLLPLISLTNWMGTTTAPPPPPSPEQIQEELNRAEVQYEKAKSMFNPWYTGPLVTPSATTVPPGVGFLQPYLFGVGTYGTFDANRHSVGLAHNTYSVKLTPILQFGLTETMDFELIPTGVVNWSHGSTGGGFSDLIAIAGWRIQSETLYVPVMKFTIGETFPTGKYKHLSTNGLGLNATGEGSYQTQFGFAIQKVIWWLYPHPLSPRFFIGYSIPTTVHVTGFNAYGGGFGTDGKVRPGNTLTTDLGLELSLTQSWVLALDIAYVAQDATKFTGTLGTNANGTPAAVGGGYNDNLSLAPAIEYNWNGNLGIVTGMQFSVYGRNSANFINGQFSVIYVW